MAGSLGELEQLLLLGLMRRSGEASGIELRQELSERAGRDLLPGRYTRSWSACGFATMCRRILVKRLQPGAADGGSTTE